VSFSDGIFMPMQTVRDIKKEVDVSNGFGLKIKTPANA